jgi:hypothetical protein
VTGMSPAIAYNAAMRRMICLILFPLGAGLVGCGGSGSPPPSAGTAGPPNFARAAYRYAACMRQHGVPVPDPQVSNQGGHQSVRIEAISPNSPAGKAAQKACAGILPPPQSPAQIAQRQHQRALGLLSFARCMRAHGVTSFPDPDAQGQINQQALANARIDIHLPSVLRAAETCVPASHGALTRADIAQAAKRGG